MEGAVNATAEKANALADAAKKAAEAAEAAVQQTNRFADKFKYTRKNYWGGPWYPYWTLIVITICGGFFGLDHFWLRSPTSGLLKILVNILGLGIWYIYDMIQIIGDQNNVMNYGLSAPMVGPLGIGAGMFVDNQPEAATSKSPFRFFAYLALVCLPFGFDFLIAGDSNGAFARFLTSLIPFFWPIGFIWGSINMLKAFFMPTSVFEDGTSRMFPMTWLGMEAHGPSVLGPKDVMSGAEKEGGGFLNVILALLPEIVQKAIMTAFPQLKVAADSAATAVQAAATAVTVGAKTAETAFEAGQQVIKAVTPPAVAAAGIASGLAQQLPAAAGSVSGIAGAVGAQLQQQATAELTKAAAGTAAGTLAANPALTTGLATASALGALPKGMTGGGYGNGDDGYASTALFVLLVSVLAGGAYMGFKRLNGALPFFKSKKNGQGQERDDTPPKPSGL